MSEIPLFKCLEIETCSLCKSKCKDCMRQTYPDNELIAPYHKYSELPMADLERIADQAKALGFWGLVCLQHHNEPTLDRRFPEICQMFRSKKIGHVFASTNADYLSKTTISKLDGCIDALNVAVYRKGNAKKLRQEELLKAFKKTKVWFNPGEHSARHYSELATPELVTLQSTKPCFLPGFRMTINFQGKMLLCCDDMIGRWNLGDIYTSTLKELWYSEKHQEIVRRISQPGGRLADEYCTVCPLEGKV